MPIQTGNMPAIGTMNNMSYFKTKDGSMVKMKSVTAKSKYKTAAFEITRRNNQEFGLAGRAGKTLRHSIRTILLNCKDARLASRLTSQLLKIAKTDTTSPHGERNVSKGQLEMLRGFDFNAEASLATNFAAPFTFNIDRAGGKISLTIPGFNSKIMLTAPEGATHFQLLSAGSAVDFVNDAFEEQHAVTDPLPLGQPTADINIVHQLPANSPLPLFLTLGIQYLLEINGAQTVIHSSNANSLAIIAVDPA